MVPIAEPMAAPAAHASPTGCIGQDIHVCAATFSQFTRRQAFGDDLERQLARNARIDVNGRPIGTGMVTLFGNAPQGGNFMLSANLDKNNRVTSANISLPGSPDTAGTAEEYDQSGLYGGVVILFGRGCVPDKIALYRAFENEIKPTIERSPKQIEINSLHASETYASHSAPISFCGHKLTYSTLLGTDTDDITLRNAHGAFVFSSLEGK